MGKFRVATAFYSTFQMHSAIVVVSTEALREEIYYCGGQP